MNDYIPSLLEVIRQFFRQTLKLGNKEAKNEACSVTKEYYNNNNFEENDIYEIAKNTDKEDELFEYANINYDYSKDDIEL